MTIIFILIILGRFIQYTTASSKNSDMLLPFKWRIGLKQCKPWLQFKVGTFLCESSSDVFIRPSWEPIGLRFGVMFEILGALLELESHVWHEHRDFKAAREQRFEIWCPRVTREASVQGGVPITETKVSKHQPNPETEGQSRGQKIENRG